MVKNFARYLGSYVETEEKCKKIAQRRTHLATYHFYYLSGCWTTDLPIHFKTTVLNATVTGALLSGLETEVSNTSQTKEIEKCHMQFMRRALGSKCAYDNEDKRKQRSNETIRGMMNLNHTDREVSKRRLK